MLKTLARLTIVSVPVTLYLYHKQQQRITIALYPNVDPTVAKKAYNRLLRRALSGEIAGMDTEDEEVMKSLFYREVWKVMSK